MSVNEYKLTGQPLNHVVEIMEGLMVDESVELLDFSVVRNNGLLETHICPEFGKISEEDEELEEV